MASPLPRDNNPPSDVIVDPATGQRLWTIGTLRYSRNGLIMLFVWLMWNDFFLMMMETVRPSLTGLLMRQHGATNTEIAFYLVSLSSACTVWINPVVSTWSDRTRTRWGRRRPFLMLAAPPAALFLGLIPWGPSIWNWFMSQGWFTASWGGGHFNGAVFAIGALSILFGVFNAVILSIFMYFFWDVVPKSVLGRFHAVAKIVTTLQAFVWNYWIFGLADRYLEWIYGVMAVLFVGVYMLSLWKVKEGEYPPPDSQPKRNPLVWVKNYCVECYGQKYYWWFFGGCIAVQTGVQSMNFTIFHWKETLGLDLDTIGKMQAWPMLGIVILGYPLGALLDRLRPVRLIGIALVLCAASNLLSFFFLRGATSLLVCMGINSLVMFIYTICFNLFNVEFFPREKLGQFCSANAIAHAIFTMLITPFVGMFFDWVKDYTYVYLWQTVFQLIAAGIFTKTYLNWRRRQLAGLPPAAATATPAAESAIKTEPVVAST